MKPDKRSSGNRGRWDHRARDALHAVLRGGAPNRDLDAAVNPQ